MNILLMLSALSAAMLLFGGTVLTNEPDEKEVNVAIGASEYLCGIAVDVRFVEVVEDSRCPEGVDCIWAGNARIRIEVSRNQKTKVPFELDTNGPAQFVDFEGVRITLKALEPYPKADKPVKREDYKAALTIKDSK